MKKLWLFLSLLVCSTLVAGCNFSNNKILDWDWMINPEELTEDYLQEKCIEHITKSFTNNWDISQSPFVSEFYKNSWTNNFVWIDYENLWIIEDYPNLWNLIWFKGYIEVNSSNLTNNRSYYLCEITEKWVIMAIRFYDPNQYTAQNIFQLHEDLINHTNAVPVLSEIETLKQSFTWTIIDWTNLGIVEITQDNTLYFNDKFWFAVVLWKEWNWWKIEAKTHNEQFWEDAISWSIAFTKKWFDHANYGLGINKNDKYDNMKEHEEFWSEEDYEKSTKWRNNKYYFIGNVGGFISPSMDTSEELDNNLFPNWFIFYDVE